MAGPPIAEPDGVGEVEGVEPDHVPPLAPSHEDEAMSCRRSRCAP